MDMQDSVRSIAFDLDAEEALNWAEIRHLVFGVQEGLQGGHSLDRRREK
jgi:hypothetical protein